MSENIEISRFKSAPWLPEDETTVVVGGAGGIGSWLTLLLARATFKPIVYDFDKYERHNMGGQFCTEKDIGKFKTEALASNVKLFTGNYVSTFNRAYDRSSIKSMFMFSSFDNMQARKDMFESWVDAVAEYPDIESIPHIFIDGRLSAEQLQIFCVTPDRIDDYREHLFDDDEVEDLPCTMKQTSHCAAMIASKMVGFFTNHMTNVKEGSDSRNVPFFYEYIIPINYTKVE